MNPSGASPVADRSSWRSVAIPSEHGGWGLSIEPVVLGLLVSAGTAGAFLGGATILAFLVRTPLKLALVDFHRGRGLARTALAWRIVAIEGLGLALCATGAAFTGDSRLWLPLLGAAPLVAVELWFGMRSRSRSLAPELAGAVGVAAVAAAIVLADGGSAELAVALWLILAARVFSSIPFIRGQVMLLHRRSYPAASIAAGDLTGLVLAAVAVALHSGTVPGAVTVGAIVFYQRISGRTPPATAVVLGVRQTVIGLTLVLITGLGVLAP